MNKNVKKLLDKLEAEGKLKVWHDYEWPKPFDNGLRLKDFLEDEVDEKFYISQEKVDKIINSSFMQEKTRIQNGEGVCSTLLARDYKDPKCVPCITPDRVEKRQNGRRFKEDGDPMFTLTGQDRHGILTESVRIGGIFDGETKHQAGAVWDKEGLCPTLDTMQGGYRQPSTILNDYRIRKLTPKECWRLMGFSDDEFQRAVDVGVSNSQLYKQAGNSIVVDVLMAIFKNLLGGMKNE